MKKSISFILITIILLLTWPGTAWGLSHHNSSTSDSKVIIYMIDNLTLNDIDPQVTPFLWSLKNNHGIGLLNTVTGGGRTIKNAAITISAGEPAVGSQFAHLNFEAGELFNGDKAGDVFYRNTGVQPKDYNIVVSTLVVIEKNNTIKELGKPGLLGDAIHSSGYNTTVIGNSDRNGYYSRLGALILMDKTGVVDNGIIGNKMTVKDPRADVLLWTDYNAVLSALRQFYNSDVILIEYGDLSRLESMINLFSPIRYQEERRQILSRIDKSIQQLEEEIGITNHCSYIISPSPSRNSNVAEALLTPIIIKKTGFEGMLTSYSTRREGVVLPTNIKNSVLNCLDSDIKDPIYTVKSDNIWQTLQSLNQKAVFNFTNQPSILTIYIAIAFILLLLSGVLQITGKSPGLKEYILLLLLTLPLGLLLISVWSIFNRHLFMITSLGLSAVIALLSLITGRIFKVNTLTIPLSLTIGVIIFDLIFNFGLIQNSIMSYQLISGVRYYGLGNEYMGIIIGATISLTALILSSSFSKFRKILTAALFLLVIFLLAYPLFGINVGGTITASIALGYTFLKLNKTTLRSKDILFLILGTLVIVAIMTAIDLSRPFELQSHLGRNMTLILNEGIGEALNIIERKVLMHLRIINYTRIGWILLGTILVLAYFLFKPIPVIKRIQHNSLTLFYGLQGIIIAAIIALLFNDSGITAAAGLTLYFWVITIYTLGTTSRK